MVEPTSNMSSGAMSYLPGYLLGDPHQESGSGQQVTPGTPGPGGLHDSLQDTPRSFHQSRVSPSRMPAGSSPYVTSTGLLSKSSIPPHNRPDYNRGSKAKLDGPPIAGLFDDLNFKNSSLNSTVASPSLQLTTSVQMNEETESPGFWIVVFGFPPSHRTEVFSIFSQLGRVLEHSFPANGNWMFLKYHSRMDICKALTHNERIVSGNVMIGVSERRSKPSPKETMNDSVQMMNKTPTSPYSPGAIRNLSVARRDTQVVNSHLVPTRDTSVVTKVMDLLFGW